MKIYMTGCVVALGLLAGGCKKKTTSFKQYYYAEYNNEGYEAEAVFFGEDDDVPADADVSLNGKKGFRSGKFIWHGDGQPDMKFSAVLLSGKQVVNSVAYADAPVYDVYFADTFSISKGGWFVFNQAVKVPGENKQIYIGGRIMGDRIYASNDTPNDTVFISSLPNTLQPGRTGTFEFAVFKQMNLPQKDGDAGGHITVSKVFKEAVYLVP